MAINQRTLKALSALLVYPTEPLLDALPELQALLALDRRLRQRTRAALDALVTELRALDALDAQERYVALFDRGRATSLHLFEHVHGESRDRGQAMVDLRQVYEREGFHLAANELPDYLPAVLEFVAHANPAVGAEILGDCAHLVRKIGEALAQRDSRYAAVLAGVLDLAGEAALDFDAALLRAPEPEPALDEQWAEEPAFLPAKPGGCGAAEPTARRAA